jgi:peptidylprolyl isomerase
MLNKSLRILVIFLGLLAGLLPLSVSAAPALDPENTIYLDLPSGRVVIQLLPNIAPRHVARIKELTRKGFYDGLSFHRVIPGFMAQTGDPLGNGTGGSGKQLKAEFSREQHIRGTVSMARAADPDTADSQFFICFAPAPFLDGQYTAWGRVVSGMEFVDKIKAGSQYNNGVVSNPTRIVRMQVAADVKH